MTYPFRTIKLSKADQGCYSGHNSPDLSANQIVGILNSNGITKCRVLGVQKFRPTEDRYDRIYCISLEDLKSDKELVFRHGIDEDITLILPYRTFPPGSIGAVDGWSPPWLTMADIEYFTVLL